MTPTSGITKLASSFRDPAGYIIQANGQIYRCITPAGEADYAALMESGLYKELRKNQLLIDHVELSGDEAKKLGANGERVIRPTQIPFISYPYEWSFSQLKDAALVTLRAQKLALAHGLIMKDASAYNVQFIYGKPILIDTLSFEPLASQPRWQAYRQFCQHFLACSKAAWL